MASVSEIRVDHHQLSLLDDESTSDSKDTIPNIVRIMDLQQEQLARSLGEGHRVIHGVAGSGKTMILVYRVEYLAQVIQKPILVLCYNVSLAARLEQMARKAFNASFRNLSRMLTLSRTLPGTEQYLLSLLKRDQGSRAWANSCGAIWCRPY
jgi:superfamily I DNA and RNA helicase